MRTGLVLVAIIAAAPVQAATVTVDGSTISVVGQIIEGDSSRFVSALAQAKGAVTVVSLDSPGGLIGEGFAMASAIKAMHAVTVVPNDGMCASACFLMFAAGDSKAISRDAKVGVHSARRTMDSKDDDAVGTLFMARAAAKLGVPSSIVGDLVETSSNSRYWLSKDDLKAMNVKMPDDDKPLDEPTRTAQANLKAAGLQPFGITKHDSSTVEIATAPTIKNPVVTSPGQHKITSLPVPQTTKAVSANALVGNNPAPVVDDE